MRKPETQIFWVNECAFISQVTDNVLHGSASDKYRTLESFSGNVDTLIRYCEMQRDFATKDGFFDSAQYIDHCIDDLKGE
jgi:hypothetical protein